MRIKRSTELHVCPNCGSDLVQPLDFVPLATGSWYVELACPNCWWRHRGVHDQEAVDRFDKELARGESAIQVAIEQIVRSGQLEEVERFARALAADAILPMDF
jgi:hypothetical protein